MIPTITFNLQAPNYCPLPSTAYSTPSSSGLSSQYFPTQMVTVQQVVKPMQASPVKFIGNYVIDYNREIGHGNFSHVYVAIDQRQPNNKLAVKVVNVDSLREQNLEHLVKCEVEILLAARHENIVFCKDALWDGSYCYIFTEYCEGGSLESKIQKSMLTYRPQQAPHIQEQVLEHFEYKLPSLSQRQMVPLIKDIFNAMLYMERSRIIHRDIKAANVFIKDSHAVVADFGFARYVNEPFQDLNIGSLPFMPPEALSKNLYSCKTDVWAFGCLVYEIFHGESPFAKSHDMKELVQKAYIPFSVSMIRNDLSTEMKELILTCLEIDMEKRKKFSEIEKLWCFKKLSENSGMLVYGRADRLKIPNSISINGRVVNERATVNQMGNQENAGGEFNFRSPGGGRSFGSRFKEKTIIGNGAKNMNYSSSSQSKEKSKRIQIRIEPRSPVEKKESHHIECESPKIQHMNSNKLITSVSPYLSIPPPSSPLAPNRSSEKRQVSQEQSDKVSFKDVLLRIQQIRNYYKLAITLKDRNKRITEIKNRLFIKSVKEINKIEKLIENDKIDLMVYDRNKKKEGEFDKPPNGNSVINRKAKLACIIKDYKTEFENQMKRRDLRGFPLEFEGKKGEIPEFLTKRDSWSNGSSDKVIEHEQSAELYGIVKNAPNYRQRVPILNQDMEYIIQTELIYHAEDSFQMSYEECQQYRNKIKEILEDIMHLEHGYLNNEPTGQDRPVAQTMKNVPILSKETNKPLVLPERFRPMGGLTRIDEMEELSRLRWKQKSNGG